MGKASKMSIIRFVCLAALTFTTFAGDLVFASKAEAQQKLSRTEITIVRPVTVLIHGAGIDAAIRMKAFEAEGLKANVSNFRGWSEVVQATMSDQGVFGFGASSLIRSVVGQDAPLRQIAMISTLYPYNFWVRQDSGIKTIQDLRGKSIQTVRPGETLDLVWTEILAGAGLTMNDVKRVEGFDGFGALISKTVDAANMNESLFAKAKKAGFMRLVDYNELRAQRGMETTGANNLGWGTSLKTLNENPDTVRAFLRALNKATIRLREDEAFATEVLSAAPYSMDADAIKEAYPLHKNRWVVRMDAEKGDFQFDIEKAREALGLPAEKMDRAKFVDPRPAADVIRELGVKY